MHTLLLTQSQVAELAEMDAIVEAVEDVFRAFAKGEAYMPPKVYLDLPQFEGDFRAMPAAFGEWAGIKWVNSHAHNLARHKLPTVMGLYVLSDPDRAVPLAVMDATWLTALRTGAAAAVATRHLARSSARTLGLIGAGVQARTILQAHAVVRPDLGVLVADRDPAVAEAFAAAYGGRAVSLEEACGADIVCTATPSRTPVVQRVWVRDGAHLNAMGADAEGKQELDVQILRDARVFVDDLAQAAHSGEINVPLHRGEIAESDLAGGLGDVIAGTLAGRRTDAELTVFDSTGLAVQDLAVAARLYTLAQARGIGTSLDFRA